MAPSQMAAPFFTNIMTNHRPIFLIRVRPEPGVDPIRALRALLKTMLRRFGLRALEAREEADNDD